ncbi:dihydroxyacetone kinase [Phlyctema vagabunda]|uniref:Dihydroxyacetone kinase n=1 Tax=Phlyctema vagabunda TaxID=108571 RepID=A0ABR4P528_9HELO
MSLGKHFINSVDDPVERGLKCLLRQDQSLRLIESQKVLYRTQTRPKVLLLSGGGSGHEPAHAGYVGEGILDICVAGQIFASPSASQVLAGLKALKSSEGVLMIVKNYTGDKLNFTLALQKAKAEGIRARAVFVGDDVSVEGNDLVGRRGLAGVVFVHKIAGALAAQGASLDEVAVMAQLVADNIFTVGVSLDRCSVPRREEQKSLSHEDLEYGMGIHNEPGVKREKISSLTSIVSSVLSFLKPSRSQTELPVAILINNLGGLSILELNVIAEEATEQLLDKYQLDIRRVLVGTFVSSLDGPGFSITILNLRPGMETLLNAKSSAPAWPHQIENASHVNGILERTDKEDTANVLHNEIADALLPVEMTLLSTILQSVRSRVKDAEPAITNYDTIAGDGDCGETLLKGANAVQKGFSKLTDTSIDLIRVFQSISLIVEQSMGGTSGAIYAIFFSAIANALSQNIQHKLASTSTLRFLSTALTEGLGELCKCTAARKGHKTLMDALIPFVETFEQTLDLQLAINAADEGAEGTRKLDAVLGRASYVSKELIEKDGGIPDPGALGVVVVLLGILEGLQK